MLVMNTRNCVCVVRLSTLGVNLLVGTESGLMLLDRSGQGKVYPLISRRRIQQMDVLEGLNVLVTISGRLYQPSITGEHSSKDYLGGYGICCVHCFFTQYSNMF